MRISIAGCLLALSLCLAPAHAQQVYYHWAGETEVWVWQGAAVDPLVLRLDAAGAVVNPPRDSLLQARFAALLPDHGGDVWSRLAARLRGAARQEQHAAAQNRQAYRGFAAPRLPDVTVGVLDSLGHFYVDFRGRTLAHRLTFRREAPGARPTALPAGQPYDWLAPLFGLPRADSAAMLQIARLFDPERTRPPGRSAAWDSLFGAWLLTLPAPPRPLRYRTDAEAGASWVWVAHRQASRTQEPPPPDDTLRNALAAAVLLALLAVAIAVATWIDRKNRLGASATPHADQPLQADDEREPDARTQIRQLRAGLDAHLDHLEKAYGRYEALLPHLPRGDEAALTQTLELARFLQAWYDRNVSPASGAAPGGASWRPRAAETQAAWFERLVEQELPERDKAMAAQQQNRAVLEKRLAEAVGVIHAAEVALERLRRGDPPDAASRSGGAQQEAAVPLSGAIPRLDAAVEGLARAMQENQDRIRVLGALKPLAGNLHRGQRSFLDLHNDAQLDNALAGLIDYSLTQLALALAAGARNEPRARAMRANLYAIARTLHVFNQKTVHGFDLAFEALKKEDEGRYRQDLPSSTDKHGPEAKPFLVRLKYLRDVARVELKPFYYLDDQNQIKTIG